METSNFRIIENDGVDGLWVDNEDFLKADWTLYQASSTGAAEPGITVVAGLTRADNNLKWSMRQDWFVYMFNGSPMSLAPEGLIEFINEWVHGYFVVLKAADRVLIYRAFLPDALGVSVSWRDS